ncbi:hypothetical protein JNUCC64_27095 [Streptomyces sp. JNUCC 64]
MRPGTGWEPGAAVYDQRTQTVGAVHARDGNALILKRPSGLQRRALVVGVRDATDREKLQLRALAQHHANATGLARLSRYLREKAR